MWFRLVNILDYNFYEGCGEEKERVKKNLLMKSLYY